MPRPVAFLSDYGLADEFVGVCHSIWVAQAPGVAIIDLTHEIPAHDVRAGALALVRSVQYLPDEAVVVAVVDPGVGTDRRLVGVQVGAVTLLGPDNGLLAPAAAMLGGADLVVDITNADCQIPAPGPTFAGRDILAPVAALVAMGTPLTALGERVDLASLIPGLLGVPVVRDDGVIDAQVWWIDRFGNCQLNLGAEELIECGVAPGGLVEIHLGGRAKSARWVTTYAEAKPSELVVLIDSYGLAALALDRASAANEYSLAPGASVVLVPPGVTPEGIGQ